MRGRGGVRVKVEAGRVRVEVGVGVDWCCVVSGLWLWPVSRLVGAMIEVGVGG